MSRYNPTERQAIVAVEMAFVSEVGWIFREQPVVDVGMDAMVEEVVGGEPMGRFIMVQVKGGPSHVHDAKHSYTYYLTRVHYEYYMRVCLPVILALHLPGGPGILWSPINRRTAKRAHLNWKLSIPKDRFLNASAKHDLTKILDGIAEDALYALPEDAKVRTYAELVEDLALLPECIQSILSLAQAYTAFSVTVNGLTSLLHGYNERHLTEKSPQIRGVLKEFNASLLKLARSQKRDLDEFVGTFSISVSAIHSMVLDPLIKGMFGAGFKPLRTGCMTLVRAIEANNPKLLRLLETIQKTPVKYSSLGSGRKEALEVTQALIEEFAAARSLVLDVVAAIDHP